MSIPWSQNNSRGLVRPAKKKTVSSRPYGSALMAEMWSPAKKTTPKDNSSLYGGNALMAEKWQQSTNTPEKQAPVSPTIQQNTTPSAPTSPSGPSNLPSNASSATGQVLANTESDEALERARRLWKSRVETAARQAQSALDRLTMGNQMAQEASLRGAYGQFRDHMRGLSGTGRGYSPRFTLAVKNALDQQQRAEAAGIRRDNIAAANEIVNGLQDTKASASEELTNEELNRLLSVSGQNLTGVSSANLAAMFNTKAR